MKKQIKVNFGQEKLLSDHCCNKNPSQKQVRKSTHEGVVEKLYCSGLIKHKVEMLVN